jgi:hypothetical protein
MTKDIGRTSSQVSKPLGQVAGEQVLQEIPSKPVKVCGIPYLASDDLVVERSLIVARKWQLVT